MNAEEKIWQQLFQISEMMERQAILMFELQMQIVALKQQISKNDELLDIKRPLG